jgi:hypothetical protein
MDQGIDFESEFRARRIRLRGNWIISHTNYYLFLPLVWPHGPIGHLGDPAPKVPHQYFYNSTKYSPFYCSITPHTQFLLLKIAKSKRDREKIQSKANTNAENILKAVEAY